MVVYCAEIGYHLPVSITRAGKTNWSALGDSTPDKIAGISTISGLKSGMCFAQIRDSLVLS